MGLQLQVTDQLINHLRVGYRVTIRFMHGDAAHYTEEVYDRLTEETASQFVEMLQWLSEQPLLHEEEERWRQLRQAPRYLELMTSLYPFEGSIAATYHKTPLAALHGGWGEDYWPVDLICRHMSLPARLDRFSVAYVDAAGDVWRVVWKLGQVPVEVLK